MAGNQSGTDFASGRVGGTAAGTTFDPTGSDLESTNVNDAIVEVSQQVPTFKMRFWRPEYEVDDDNVDVGANTITLPDHRLATGTQGAFASTWGGFTASTPYFVIRDEDNPDVIQLATTFADARAGVARDISALPGGAIEFTSTNGHHVFGGRVHKTKTEMTFEIVDADVDPAADTITIPDHPFTTAHGIQFASTWGGVTSGTLYYAIVLDKDTIQVASSYINAHAGTPVDITADPGGAVSLFGCYAACFYDAFIIPQLNAEYVISIGYGGSHVMLLGMDGGGVDGRIAVTGNVSIASGGSVDVGFNSGGDEGFIGKPLHIAILIYNGVMVVFMNGVPCKRFAKTTGRGADDFTSDATCFIGGSDHSNYEGDMYWVRIFENAIPQFYSSDNGGCLRVNPRPRVTYYDAVIQKHVSAVLLHNYSQPATTIANLGVPLYPDRTNEGTRSAGTEFSYFSDFASFEEWELPQQLRTELPELPDYGLTPTTPPPTAKIFDSFKRNDVVRFWGNYLGLGSTEGGTLGVKRWLQTHPAPISTPRHGVLFGRAYVDGTGADTTVEYVENDTNAMIVEIENVGNETVGAVLFAAYDFDTDTGYKAVHGALDTIVLYRVEAGVPTSLGNYVIAGENVPYTLGIEYTSTQQARLRINGVAEVDADESAEAEMTEVNTGFTATVGYCRFEDFAVYAASA